MAFRPNRMKELREAVPLSQEELAIRVGIKQQHISRYETGKRHPSSDAVNKIAGALKTTSDYLLGRTDDPLPLSENERRFIDWLRGLPGEPTSEDVIFYFASQDVPRQRPPRAKR